MTSTDRELLEAAAKAAGHRIVEWTTDGNGVDVAIIVRSGGDGFSKRPWQPLLENQLTDADGDALRLAVKLHIRIHPMPGFGDDCVCCAADHKNAWAQEPLAGDDEAATRRAIVRAAAELWKTHGKINDDAT